MTALVSALQDWLPFFRFDDVMCSRQRQTCKKAKSKDGRRDNRSGIAFRGHHHQQDTCASDGRDNAKNVDQCVRHPFPEFVCRKVQLPIPCLRNVAATLMG